MDLQNFLYELKRNPKLKRKAKTILIILFGIILLGAIFLISVIVFAFNNYTQLYEGFTRITQYIFGNSPENTIRSLFKQITDNLLNNIFGN